MTTELAPCQTTLGAMVQSRLGSAITCQTGNALLVVVMDETGGQYTDVPTDWKILEDIEFFEQERALFPTVGVLDILVIHLPESTDLPLVWSPLLPSLPPGVFPDEIRFRRINLRPQQSGFATAVVDVIPRTIRPDYVRLAGDASGSVLLDTSVASWDDIVRRAKRFSGWDQLSETADPITLHVRGFTAEDFVAELARSLKEARAAILA